MDVFQPASTCIIWSFSVCLMVLSNKAAINIVQVPLPNEELLYNKLFKDFGAKPPIPVEQIKKLGYVDQVHISQAYQHI